MFWVDTWHLFFLFTIQFQIPNNILTTRYTTRVQVLDMALDSQFVDIPIPDYVCLKQRGRQGQKRNARGKTINNEPVGEPFGSITTTTLPNRQTRMRTSIVHVEEEEEEEEEEKEEEMMDVDNDDDEEEEEEEMDEVNVEFYKRELILMPYIPSQLVQILSTPDSSYSTGQKV